MVEILDLPQSGLRNGPEIEYLRVVCLEHGIGCGTPDDLLAFPWQISNDENLQSEVFSFVRRLQHQSRCFAEILSILILGVGGPTAAATDEELYSTTSLLTSFLVSLGEWSFADLEQATRLEDEIRIELSRDPLEIGRSRAESLATRVNVAPSADQDEADPGNRQLIEIITRLEKSNLELREKLESIDQRIRRMTPASEGFPGDHYPDASGLSSPSDQFLPFNNPVPFVAAPDSGRYTRLSSTPTAPRAEDPADRQIPSSHAGPPPTSPEPVLPARSRFLTDEAHRADQKRITAPMRRRRIIQAVVFAAAVLAAGAGALYTSLHPSSGRKTPPEAAVGINGEPGIYGSGSGSVSDASGPDAPTPDQAETQSSAAQASVPVPSSGTLISRKPTAARGSNVDTSSDSAIPTPPPHITIYSAPESETGGGSRRRSDAAADTGNSDSSSRDALPAGSASDNQEPVTVSSSVMAEHLVSSSPPSYPRLAAMSHLQGVVVLKATISRRGSVEHVQALGGNYLLRGAATSAVRNWRYRPYLVHGKPVEVATLVTIDFALHR